MIDKKLRITNAIFGVAIFIFIMTGWFISKPVVYSYLDGADEIIQPQQVSQFEDNGTMYKFRTKDLGDTTYSLVFYTNHQEVYVYADDTLVYSCEKTNTIYSKSTGSVMNVVDIPYNTKALIVVTKPVFSDVSTKSIEFHYGNGVYLYESIIQDSLWEMVVCLLVFGMGLCLTIYFYMLGTKSEHVRDVLHLGIFSLILGVWIFGETRGAMLILANRPLASYTAFTCIMIVPIPFLYFIKYFMRMKDRFLHRIFFIVNVIFFFTLQGMQLTGYRELRQNSLYCQLPIFISFIYYFIAIFSNLKKKKMKNRIIINMVGGVVMIGCLIADMVYYYVDRAHANRFGKYGFVVYIILLGAETARGAKVRLDEERKNNLYREMAVMDMLTDCYNRNALNEDIKNTFNARGCHALNFDLNNLKTCNDNLGHKEGDKYLMGSAKLICTTFGKYGKVYRTGGDEFCVITNNIDTNKVEELIAQMRADQEKFYKAPDGYFLGIAVGYAKYDALEDRNLLDTLERADEVMYEDKKRLKQEQRKMEEQMAAVVPADLAEEDDSSEDISEEVTEEIYEVEEVIEEEAESEVKEVIEEEAESEVEEVIEEEAEPEIEETVEEEAESEVEEVIEEEAESEVEEVIEEEAESEVEEVIEEEAESEVEEVIEEEAESEVEEVTEEVTESEPKSELEESAEEVAESELEEPEPESEAEMESEEVTESETESESEEPAEEVIELEEDPEPEAEVESEEVTDPEPEAEVESEEVTESGPEAEAEQVDEVETEVEAEEVTMDTTEAETEGNPEEAAGENYGLISEEASDSKPETEINSGIRIGEPAKPFSYYDTEPDPALYGGISFGEKAKPFSYYDTEPDPALYTESVSYNEPAPASYNEPEPVSNAEPISEMKIDNSYGSFNIKTESAYSNPESKIENAYGSFNIKTESAYSNPESKIQNTYGSSGILNDSEKKN